MERVIIPLLTEKSPYHYNISLFSFQSDVRILYEPVDFLTLVRDAANIN